VIVSDERRTVPRIGLAVSCAECGSASDGQWHGWLACRTDEPGTDDVPEVAYFCPDCAARKFAS
jgi:hypothetical protein